MKNRDSTLIFTIIVEVHPRNINTKFVANRCSGLRVEVEKLKKVHADEYENNDDDNNDDDDDGHRVIARFTLIL